MYRILINLSLCILFAVGVYCIVRTSHPGAFSGELLLPLEGRSGIAVAKAGENLGPFPQAHRIYTGQSLRALEPLLPTQAITLLDPAPLYDAVELPFVLQLDSTTFFEPSVATHSLTVEDAGGKAERPIEEGERVEVGGVALEAQALRTWAGLYPTDRGKPAAAVALRIGASAWIEHVFAREGQWSTFEPEGAVRLTWVASEDDGRAVLAARAAESGAMRWGVTEGDRTHWFDGAQSGTGVTLDDGRTVTLLGYDAGGDAGMPAIEVVVEQPDEGVRYRIEANRTSPDGLVRFDYPEARRYRVDLYAWQDNKALVTGVLDGHLLAPVVVERGQIVEQPDTGVQVRFDSAYGAALAVRETESTVSECVLAGEGVEYHVRHGERVRVGNGAVTYRRKATAALANLRIIAHHRATGQVTTKLLEPHTRFRVLRWQITQKPLPTDGLDAFVIEARYDPGMGMLTWFGAGLCAVSSALLVIRAAAFVWRRSSAGLSAS